MIMRFHSAGILIASLMMGTGSQAVAQNGQADIMTPGEFQQTDIYTEGISARSLLANRDVLGPNGDEIGVTSDLVVTPEGEVLALIAEVGGFWDIGDTHVAIPWDEVDLNFADSSVRVPVTEESVDQYDPFTSGFMTGELGESIVTSLDDEALGPRAWRVTELLNDYATYGDETNNYQPYGYVRDVIIRNGEIAATVVTPSAGYGTGGFRAFPYYGFTATPGAWNPASPFYVLPYDPSDISSAVAFDYDQLDWGAAPTGVTAEPDGGQNGEADETTY